MLSVVRPPHIVISLGQWSNNFRPKAMPFISSILLIMGNAQYPGEHSMETYSLRLVYVRTLKAEPVAELDEKSELRSSPVQEQHPSLPFGRDVDANVAEMHNAGPYDDLNMSEEISHLVAIDTKEYERYKRAYC